MTTVGEFKHVFGEDALIVPLGKLMTFDEWMAVTPPRSDRDRQYQIELENRKAAEEKQPDA